MCSTGKWSAQRIKQVPENNASPLEDAQSSASKGRIGAMRCHLRTLPRTMATSVGGSGFSVGTTAAPSCISHSTLQPSSSNTASKKGRPARIPCAEEPPWSAVAQGQLIASMRQVEKPQETMSRGSQFVSREPFHTDAQLSLSRPPQLRRSRTTGCPPPATTVRAA